MGTRCTYRAYVRTMADEQNGLAIEVSQERLILREIRQLDTRFQIRSE
jgi:hypothetical protein